MQSELKRQIHDKNVQNHWYVSFGMAFCNVWVVPLFPECVSVRVRVRVWFWIKTLLMFPDKYRVLWLVFETTNQMSRFQPLSRGHYWELIVAFECSKVFLASKWMVFSSFSFTHLFACSVLFFSSFLLSVLWACYAQPHKLTDSSMGHGVIRWRQYHSVSSQYQDQPSQLFDLMLLPSHVCVLDTTLRRRCLRHAGTWLPSLSVLGVTYASAQAHISLQLSGVTKGYIPRSTAYMPYWNAKCCLILVFWCSLRIEHFVWTCRGPRQVLRKKSHLFTDIFLFSLFFLMLCFDIV